MAQLESEVALVTPFGGAAVFGNRARGPAGFVVSAAQLPADDEGPKPRFR